MRGGEYTSPKTILGFLAAITAIGAALAVGLAVALAGTNSLHFLIIISALFMLLLVCGVIGIVVAFAWRDPSKLLLGQVTAKDYIAIQKLGDDTFGEIMELPDATTPQTADQSDKVIELGPTQHAELDTPNEGEEP